MNVTLLRVLAGVRRYLQHVRAGARAEPIGRVRLAARELLGGERAAEPLDVVAHPAFEPVERQRLS